MRTNNFEYNQQIDISLSPQGGLWLYNYRLEMGVNDQVCRLKNIGNRGLASGNTISNT
jgi:hypothetical protein